MKIIDAQLHEPAISLDWKQVDAATRNEILTELQLGFMRAAGVDRAVLFPVDNQWGSETSARFPDRFGFVPMITVGGALGAIDALAPDLDEAIAQLAANTAVVGMRILRTMPRHDGDQPIVPLETFSRAAAACERLGLPLFMSTAGELSAPAEVAKRHPGLTVIVDHLGLPQPPTHPRESPPFKSLDDVLALAEIPNIAGKMSGLPTLSEQPYPFTDLWPHLRRVVDAFGAERLMWGSDISRIHGRVGFDVRISAGEKQYPGKHSYGEALLYVRESDELSAQEKEMILGGTAQKLLRWAST